MPLLVVVYEIDAILYDDYVSNLETFLSKLARPVYLGASQGGAVPKVSAK